MKFKFDKDFFKTIKHPVLSVIIHAVLATLLGVIILITVFWMYLPSATNHGESVTVPDLEGITIDQLNEFLTDRNLNYVITKDSGYSAKYPPKAVLKQVPLPNTKVKENRKIYLTLNAENPPLVKMPDLVDGSVKSAQLVLKSFGLTLGEIKYVPDLAQNAVLQQFYEDDSIAPGVMIPKGSVIDLEAGDGLGNQEFDAPNLIGLDVESAKIAIVGSGLKVGDVLYKNQVDQQSDTLMAELQIVPGMVVKQKPNTGNVTKIGKTVDIWVYKPVLDSLLIENKPE